MIINDNDLFYTCSLLELIGRVTRQKRGAVVDILGKKVVAHIYASAETLICEPIAHTADEFIEMYRVPQGEFDNLASCKYEIPDYGTIGKVYARLIEDVAREDLIDSLFQVYASEVSDMISDYNTDFYNQARDYIKDYFITNGDPDGIDLRIPDIRFKGFTGEWDQRKAKDLFVSSSDKGYPELPVLSATQDRGMIKRDDNGINIFHDKKNEEGYKRVVPGQFVIHLRSFQGGFAHSSIEGITSPAYTIFGFQEPEKHDDNYWKYIFSSKEFIRRLETVTYGIRDGRCISYEEFLTMVFCYPRKLEQTVIAEYLDKSTALIALHERKCERLQNVKKSMLEKMFPKKGSNVPEIRFAGFTEPWEMRKLGEIIQLNGRIGFRGYTEKDIISKEDGGILTFSPTNIVDNKLTTNCKNTYITRFKYDESPEIKVHNGDILFVKTGSTLGKSALITGIFEDATLNPQVVVMRPRIIASEFVSVLLITEILLKQVNSAKIGGAVPTLTETKIKDFDILVPTNIKEQKQIGLFFTHLDNVITFHQRELEKLKNIKKSMLEKMFV